MVYHIPDDLVTRLPNVLRQLERLEWTTVAINNWGLKHVYDQLVSQA